MARFAKQYETLPNVYTFSSQILSGLRRYNGEAPSKKWREHYLNRLTDEQYDCQVFDRFREEWWFKAVMAELTDGG